MEYDKLIAQYSKYEWFYIHEYLNNMDVSICANKVSDYVKHIENEAIQALLNIWENRIFYNHEEYNIYNRRILVLHDLYEKDEQNLLDRSKPSWLAQQEIQNFICHIFCEILYGAELTKGKRYYPSEKIYHIDGIYKTETKTLVNKLPKLYLFPKESYKHSEDFNDVYYEFNYGIFYDK